MNASDHIRYLKRQEIDTGRWDTCIDRDPGGLIYGRSFYLDAITAGKWDALVWKDYQAVMPLTWNRKLGFYYLYQPFFTPVLGVFGNRSPQEIPVATFLQAIPPRYRLWDIDLREANSPVPAANGLPVAPGHILPLPPGPDLPWKANPRRNYFLRLDRPYEEIYAGYRRLARRMLKRSKEEQLQVIRDAPPSAIIGHYRQAYGKILSDVPGQAYERILACAIQAGQQGNLHTYLAQTRQNTIAAFYLVFYDDRFVYSVLGGSTPEGKEKGAFYQLTDAVIRDHAGSSKTLRFEGSDVPGIAFFNTLFGPEPAYYSHLLLNRLPFPINLLKRLV